MADKIATRQAYGEALIELVEKNDKVVVLDADLANATQTCKVAKAHPEKFYNCGIAEANMVDIAAGMSTMGLIPYCSSFAMFAAGRAFEQVRNAVGYPHLNVKIGATHAGVSVGEDGATHQCCEDIGLMRTIPGMVILNPADAVEAKKAVFAAAAWDGPVYLRFGRLALPVVTDEAAPFTIGQAQTLREGGDVTIIATGLPVGMALEAAELLAAEGIAARVVNMAPIKPIDRDAVARAAAETGAIVTVEEHNIIGGLGSAVAEVVCETTPVPVVRVGVQDTFGRSGPAAELLTLFGFTPEHIAEAAREAIARKKN